MFPASPTLWCLKRESQQRLKSQKKNSSATPTRGSSILRTSGSLIGKFQIFRNVHCFLNHILNEFEYLRQVAVALSPDLAENEMRIVLSWETTQDLDLYALQMDKYYLNWI